jgi:hypothetical protein
MRNRKKRNVFFKLVPIAMHIALVYLNGSTIKAEKAGFKQ